METNNKEMIEAMKEIRDLAERSIKELARARALMLKTGAEEDDVTHFINTCGEHYGEMYDKMSLDQLMLDITGDILKGLAKMK